MLGLPKRRLIDRNSLQYPLVGAALLIAIVMLTPPLSPVLVSSETLPMFAGPRSAGEVARAGFNDDFEPRPLPPPTEAKGILMTGYAAGGDAQFVQQTDEVGISPVVEHDEAGIHRVGLAREFHVHGMGVAADVVVGFEHGDVVLAV